jgi:hypothetical protein
MSDPVRDPVQLRLPDGGPSYVETPPDLERFSGVVAEPWNTGSATLFVLIALAWVAALRGRYREHPFLTMCLPLLATGGIGGVLFHGLRRFHAFFLMDVIPIYVLGLMVTVWLWVRLGPKLRHLVGVIGFLALMQLLAHFNLPTHWAINFSYASLAFMVFLPLALSLLRTRSLRGGWVYTALACFAIAWTCRIADIARPPYLPMGTHWLWHVFGALTTASLSVYIFLIESTPLKAVRAKATVAT